MPELVIKYKNKKTLEALLAFSRFFDFSVIQPKKAKSENAFQVNGVTLLAADKSVDIKELDAIFSGKNIDSRKLRENAWRRTM